MGLDPMNQAITKNAADGSFMDKSFARETQILDKMAKHNQTWHSEETTGGVSYGSPSLSNLIKENQERDQVIARLATNVNVLTKMFTEIQKKKVNALEDVQPILDEHFEEVNYINNPQGGYQRQPYHAQGQQSQWRPNPQGQGNQQWRNDQGEEAEQEVEVEEQGVVEVERVPQKEKVQEVNQEGAKEKEKETSKAPPPIPRHPPPFPQRLIRRVDDTKLEKFYDILKQFSVNIPFLEAFQEMPGFDKYLKDLITKKRTTKNEVVNMTHLVSSIIATSHVQKKKDPRAFTIPCTIGERDFAKALCDNGASINLMPLAIYKQAGLGMTRATSMRLQMSDRSIK
ncbi:uncharacterized protein [Nicotiana sylvestris]|uniref:uncharacterized protein n=1 Tax=Nicotiana sylvestris TaxID=4096 RepID=UPI00388CE030